MQANSRVWTPAILPPHPSSLTTYGTRMFSRIMEAMKKQQQQQQQQQQQPEETVQASAARHSYSRPVSPPSFSHQQNVQGHSSDTTAPLAPTAMAKEELMTVTSKLVQTKLVCTGGDNNMVKLSSSRAGPRHSNYDSEDGGSDGGDCRTDSANTSDTTAKSMVQYQNSNPPHYGTESGLGNENKTRRGAERICGGGDAGGGGSKEQLHAAAVHSSALRQKDSYPWQTNPDSSSASSSSSSVMRDMEAMMEQELEETVSMLGKAREVAATLVYSDGSSQLRKNNMKKMQANTEVPKAHGICVAFPYARPDSSGPPVLQCLLFPLFSSQANTCRVCRDIITSLMKKARVITYKGQELVASILDSYKDITSTIWKDWAPLDVFLGAWLLDPDLAPPGSFSELLSRFGLQQMTPLTAGYGQEAPSSFREMLPHDLSLLGPVMVRVYKELQEKKLLSVFLNMECKLIAILAAMGEAGLQINCSKLLEYGDIFKKKIAKAAGRHFPINSTSQLREYCFLMDFRLRVPSVELAAVLAPIILFDELHLDDNKRLTKTHVHQHKSTSEAVLTQLCHLHPLPKLVLEYRHLCKTNATCITGFMSHITEERTLKPTWLQTSAATGRLVSCNPNIQAFPKSAINLGVVQEQFIVGKPPVEVEINMREVIESRAGFTFLAADYKSIELRVLAHLSSDTQLLSAFNNRTSKDIFISLTSEWLGVEPSRVTAEERERTKHVVYAVVYGVGKERLGEILKNTPAIAKEFTDSFLAKFPGVRDYISKTVSECRGKGCLSTICQRRRWFSQISSPLPQIKAHAERQAINFPVQGSAADICKLGMIEVTQMLASESPSSRLLVQIHDELLFEIPDEEVTQVPGKVKAILEAVGVTCKLQVPLEVKMSMGKTWASLAPHCNN